MTQVSCSFRFLKRVSMCRYLPSLPNVLIQKSKGYEKGNLERWKGNLNNQRYLSFDPLFGTSPMILGV